MTSTTPGGHTSTPFEHLSVSKMPAHWLMARLGKRVLRPGGAEMTRWILDQLRIGPTDDVIELAPGLGHTARRILAHGPRTYVGVEREPEAIAQTERALAGQHGSVRIVRADASSIPLPDACASIVVGEAMLTMHPETKKQAIVAEARRLLRAGGAYAIHELALLDPDRQAAVERDFSSSIHVGVRIATVPQWTAWLEQAGFEVDRVTTSPMHLLEISRVVRDEGLLRAVRFAVNAIRLPGAARRLREVRAVFRKYETSIAAVAMIARR